MSKMRAMIVPEPGGAIGTLAVAALGGLTIVA
jgi:hypothetical protein